jgi:hypothetical protein
MSWTRMSWLRALDTELRLLGMGGRDRERIVLELADHIDCDPGGEERLGDPAALAAAFVDELASAKSRRAAFDVLAALAVTAVVLAVSLRILGQAGYPGFNGPLGQVLVWPALFGVLIAPQVALVCGTLAALRAFRCRGAAVLPAAEVALITRRASLGLAAGIAVTAGVALSLAAAWQRLPAAWLGLAGGLGVLAAAALVRGWRGLGAVRRLRSGAGGPGGSIYDDLPVLSRRWLVVQPWRLGLLTSLLAAVLMTAMEARVERSLAEGLQRGLIEGLAAGIGFAVLGGAIGATGPRPQRAGRPSA